jgi:hypothetical protein
VGAVLGGFVALASTAGCSLVTSWAGYVGDGGAAAPDAQAEAEGQQDSGTQGESSAPETSSSDADGDGQAGDSTTRDGEPTDAPAIEDGPSDGPGGEGMTDAVAADSANPGGDGGDASDASSPISFVQVTASTNTGSVSTASATFAQAQSAGDLIVLVVGWGGNASITQVSDSAGNGYAATIAPTHISAGITQAIYYAKGIAAAAAGGNSVTVTLNAVATPVDLRAAEYSGLDPVAPFDVSFAFGGRATTATSLTPVTTASARELIFGAGITVGSFTGAGAAFTLRKLTGAGIGVVEDRVVSAIGSYTADAPLASSASYVMQVATFR